MPQQKSCRHFRIVHIKNDAERKTKTEKSGQWAGAGPRRMGNGECLAWAVSLIHGRDAVALFIIIMEISSKYRGTYSMYFFITYSYSSI